MSSPDAVAAWVELPQPPSARPDRRVRRILIRFFVGFTAAAGLWALGLRVAALAVDVTVTVLTAISLVLPRLGRGIDDALRRFGDAVGRVLTLVLLTLVHLLVFTPAALVLRLARHDPLAPGVRPGDPSFWHLRSARSLPKRQFADERALWSRVGEIRAHRRPVFRLCTAVGVVTVVLGADLGAGWVYDELSSASTRPAAVADDTFDPASQPALARAPWARDAIEEQSKLPGTPDTYLGYRLGDLDGLYTHVVDGVRRSYEPPVSGPRLRIDFFGGSALFGEAQRDDHTIPSEVARVAEADGIPVEVRNYGRPGIAMWQELQLFEQVLAKGDRPDVVVFYDGFNDLAWQLNIRLSTEPANVFDTSIQHMEAVVAPDAVITKRRHAVSAPTTDNGTSVSDVLGAYWNQSASRHVYEAVRDLIDPPGTPSPRFAAGVPERDTTAPVRDDIKTAAHNAISIQRRAADLITRIAKGSGFRAAFFWQPFVYTKRLLPEERAYLQLPKYEPARWVPAVREARKLLKPPIIDLGDALDPATEPVLWDFVHTNEDGARLVAEAVYGRLRPQLEQQLRVRGIAKQ